MEWRLNNEESQIRIIFTVIQQYELTFQKYLNTVLPNMFNWLKGYSMLNWNGQVTSNVHLQKPDHG